MNTPTRSRWKKWGKRFIQGLAGLLLVLLLVLLLLLGALQTPWGANKVREVALTQINQTLNGSVYVEQLEGNFLSNLTLKNVSVTQGDTLLTELEAAHLRFSLFPLLNNTIKLRSVTLTNPAVSLWQYPDSSWNAAHLLPTADTVDTAATTAWAVVIDRFEINSGRVEAHFYAPNRDSLLKARRLEILAHDLLVDENRQRFNLERFTTDLYAFDNAAVFQLGATAALTDERFQLDTLHAVSDESRFLATGRYIWENRGPDQPPLTLNLQADPLLLKDLHAFVPSIPAQDTLIARADVYGTPDQLHLDSEARLSTGATFTANGYGTFPPENQLQYKGTADLTNLNVSYLTGQTEGLTNISAHMSIDLQGPRLEQLSGSANLEIFDLMWNQQPLRPTELATNWNNGQITFDGHSTLTGGEITFEGQTKPWAREPSYEFSSIFRGLNLSRLPGGVDPNTNLNGQLTASGTGFKPETVSGQGQLTLNRSTYDYLQINPSELRLQINDQVVEASTQISLDGGKFQLQGTAAPFQEPMRYKITNGSFRQINLAALLQDTTQVSNLNGTFSLAGTGTAPEQMELRGQMDLSASTYAGRQLTSARMEAELNQQLSFEAALSSPGGSFHLTGRGQPFADVPALEQAEGRYHNIDLNYLLQDTTYTSSLNGTFTLTAAGTDSATAFADGQLTIDSSRVNQQLIPTGRLSFHLEDQQAALKGQLDLANGQLTLQGQARPFASVPTYSLTNTRFQNIHLGRWLNQPDLYTDLNGHLELTGQGTSPEDLFLNTTLAFDSSTVNLQPIENANLNVQLENGQLTTNSRFTYPGGFANLQGSTYPFADTVQFSVDGEFDQLQPTALAGIDTLTSSLSMRFNLNGGGPDWSDLNIEGMVAADSSYLEDVVVDTLLTRFRYQDYLLQTQSLFGTSNVATFNGDGQIALPQSSERSQFTFDATVHTLTPVAALTGLSDLEGRGTMHGRVFGSTDRLRFDVETEFSGVEYGDLHAAVLEGRAVGEYTDSLAMNAHLNLEAVALPTFVADRIVTDVQYAGSTVNFNNQWFIDQNREGRFKGRVEMAPDQQRVVLDSLNMRLDSQQWQLLREASISYGQEYRVRNLLLYHNTQQIAVDGVIDPDGPSDLILTMETVEIGPVTDLLGYTGLNGVLNGTVIFTGPSNAPVLEGDLLLSNFSSDERRVGDFSVTVNYSDFQMRVRALLEAQQNEKLLIEGEMATDLAMTADPPDSQTQTLSLRTHADSLSIGWIGPFLDPAVATDPEGFISADVTISGAYEAPVTKGFLRLSSGAVSLTDLGTRYNDINLLTRFRDDALYLERASMHSGPGRMTMEGSIQLNALNFGRFDLAINSENFRAASTRTYRMTVDTDLQMQGTTERPVLDGEITLTSGTFNLTEEITGTSLQEVTLTEEDIRTVETRFGLQVTDTDTSTYDFYEAMVIDTVQVNIERGVWLRSSSNPEMAIEYTGELILIKPAQADLELFGTIEVVPERSYVEQFGRRFDISTGTLTFTGPMANPILDLEAEYRVRGRTGGENQAVISLALSGPIDNLQPTLSSPEGLTTTEMVSYLALGRPPQQSFRQSSSAESIARSAAVSQLTEVVEGLATSELGIDIIEIQHDEELGATLTAGSYLTNEIFASVSWPISLSSNNRASTLSTRQLTLEYLLTNWLLLRLQRRNQVLGIDLLWEYSY